MERVRGRKAVELRKRRLHNEPLCRECAKQGIVSEAVVPDHIIPLAFGGTDTEDNVQCLCAACHAIKTASEDAAHNGAANHPDWLPRSNVPLTIVCGPPCSGKSTYVHDKVGTIIDIDGIALSIDPTYKHWEGMLTGALLNKAIRTRNAMLANLRAPTWFIVSAPSPSERDWWREKLGGQVVLLDPGRDECIRRAKLRGTPNAIAGIKDWYDKSISPWSPHKKKIKIGIDGWPII
jgi:hypothetical protein